jgi:methionyl-tRNA synthetase
VDEKKRYYVTTPIYYVNDKPHIGHAYATILADVLKRYHAMFGCETFFLTGVDEHGQKVEEAAKKRGMTPQEHCDEMQAHFRNLWPTLDVSNDDFIRTTEKRHETVVVKALEKLWVTGDIYKGQYEGFYSSRVEKFFTEDELIDGKCPETGGEVNKIVESNYFFKMSKYQQHLLDHIAANPDFIRPESRRNEVLGFLRKPLQDLCISRPKSRLSWGIELPFDPDFVTYVWFDALINYVSVIGLYSDDERFAKWWPHVHHLIGKDILTTHSVYWTTMLFALGIAMPKHIIAHGWWLIDSTKMSKSLGNVVSPLEMKEKYGVDSLRYFLMREMVVGLDSDFSEQSFLKRHNYELANDLGNLANRLCGFAAKQFDGIIPEPGSGSGHPADAEVMAMAEALPGKVTDLVENLRIEAAIEAVMNFVRRLNRYVAETEPFKVIKTDRAAAGAAVYIALEGLRFALNMLWPIMPGKVESILAALGGQRVVSVLDDLKWGGLVAGSVLTLAEPPFPRHEMPEFTESPVVSESKVAAPPAVTEAKSAPQVAATEAASEFATFDDFLKIQLKVGTVLSAEPVSGSDKLLKLAVDLGEEKPRQIVAGIGLKFDVATLPGTQITVVANLKPRKVFGVLSEGMILAAEDEDGMSLVAAASRRKPGTRIG